MLLAEANEFFRHEEIYPSDDVPEMGSGGTASCTGSAVSSFG
jgi:hypothetical protein